MARMDAGARPRRLAAGDDVEAPLGQPGAWSRLSTPARPGRGRPRVPADAPARSARGRAAHARSTWETEDEVIAAFVPPAGRAGGVVGVNESGGAVLPGRGRRFSALACRRRGGVRSAPVRDQKRRAATPAVAGRTRRAALVVGALVGAPANACWGPGELYLTRDAGAVVATPRRRKCSASWLAAAPERVRPAARDSRDASRKLNDAQLVSLAHAEAVPAGACVAACSSWPNRSRAGARRPPRKSVLEDVRKNSPIRLDAAPASAAAPN